MRTIEVESARSASALTPNDGALLPRVTRAITLGVAGDIVVDMADGSNVTIKGLTVGVMYYIAIRKLYATGTTATNIIGYYV